MIDKIVDIICEIPSITRKDVEVREYTVGGYKTYWVKILNKSIYNAKMEAKIRMGIIKNRLPLTFPNWYIRSTKDGNLIIMLQMVAID